MLHQTKARSNYLCIELLSSFTKKELKKFNHFVKSPYFNKDPKLTLLFELIQKYVLDKIFDEKLQNKIYAVLFEKRPVKNLAENEKKVFRTKLSKLNQLAHKFLVNENLNENKNCFNDLLYTCLLDKKQFNAYQLLVKRDKKNLLVKERKETKDYDHLYKIEMHHLDYLFQSGSVYKKLSVNFNEIDYRLDIQYLIKKFTLFGILLSNRFLSENYSMDFTTSSVIENLMLLPQYKNHPNLIILNSTVNFLKYSNEKSYYHLLNLFETYKNKIPLDHLKALCGVITNFLHAQLKKGQLQFEQELINFYDLLDNENLLLEEKLMPAIKLVNIVAKMCQSMAFEKAEYFTGKYVPYVRKTERKSVQDFCLAVIEFYKGNYEDALDYITIATGMNVYFESNYRILMMKIYYERDKAYSEKTERFYRSIEKFFNDNKSLSTENKKSCKGFAQIMINLYRLKHKEGRMTLQKLKAKLEQQDYNIGKNWLLKKIEELRAYNL